MDKNLKKLFEKELTPQVNPHKILMQKAEQAEKEGNLEDAILYLESALLANPENKTAKEKLKLFEQSIGQRYLHLSAATHNPESLKDAITDMFKSLLHSAQQLYSSGPYNPQLRGIHVVATDRRLGDIKLNESVQKPNWSLVSEGKQAVQLKFGNYIIQAIKLTKQKKWIFTAYCDESNVGIESIILEWKENQKTQSRKFISDEHYQTILTDEDVNLLTTHADAHITVLIRKK